MTAGPGGPGEELGLEQMVAATVAGAGRILDVY